MDWRKHVREVAILGLVAGFLIGFMVAIAITATPLASAEPGIKEDVAVGLGLLADPQETDHDHSDPTQEHDHTHSHDEMLTMPENVATPEVLIKLTEKESSYTLYIETSNFRLAPEKVNTANAWGEGHAHLYVNDVKITRLYDNYYMIDELQRGDEVKVTLTTNDHKQLVIDGEPIQDTLIVQ